MGRNVILLTFQATNERNLGRQGLVFAKKRKPLGRN